MRKITSILFINLFVALSLNAQSLIYGSVDALKGESFVAVEFDFTKGIYDAEEFNYEELVEELGNDAEKEFKELAGKFRSAANEKIGSAGISFLRKANAETRYRIVACPIKVEHKGFTRLRLTLYQIDLDRPLAIIEVTGDGGTFGSFINLFGDGLDSCGENFGRWLKRQLSEKQPAVSSTPSSQSTPSTQLTPMKKQAVICHARVKGRDVLGELPSPASYHQASGVVVVDIWVDQYGNVVKAVAGGQGTTTTDAKVWTAARNAAIKAHFNTSADAPALQKGTITYEFKMK
ncbi:MAG: energy transducer TonB [Bacteroidaceae bacterium]|nr:energy transducer TonB [Bacteroidaceae bacterium]